MIANFGQTLGTRQHPVGALVPDALKNSRGHREGVVENPHVSFFPNFPRDKNDRRLEPLARVGGRGCQVFPVVEDGGFSDPKTLHQGRAFQPSGGLRPNPFRKAAFEENMTSCLRLVLA